MASPHLLRAGPCRVNCHCLLPPFASLLTNLLRAVDGYLQEVPAALERRHTLRIGFFQDDLYLVDLGVERMGTILNTNLR